MFASGKRNTLISIQAKQGDPSRFGASEPAWVEVGREWASLKAPTGLGQINGEFKRAGQEVSRVQYSARIPFRIDLNAGMRVVAVSIGMVFEIRQVIPDLASRQHTDLVLAIGGNKG